MKKLFIIASSVVAIHSGSVAFCVEKTEQRPVKMAMPIEKVSSALIILNFLIDDDLKLDGLSTLERDCKIVGGLCGLCMATMALCGAYLYSLHANPMYIF